MRFPLPLLATAALGILCGVSACERSGSELKVGGGKVGGDEVGDEKASERTASANRVIAPPASSTATLTLEPALSAPSEPAQRKAPEAAPAPSGAGAPAASGSAPRATTAAPPSDEGNGEPMDDVDDEDGPGSGVWGAEDGTHEEAASAPVDDLEGADIQLRE